MDNPVKMRLLPESDTAYGGQFRYDCADALESAFNTEANRLDGQAASRAAAVADAKIDFQGRFSEIFQENAATAATSASNLATALREAAGLVQQLYRLAKEEDGRREENNEWVQEYLDRNGWEKFQDWWTGGEERPNMDPVPGPAFPVGQPVVGTRAPMVGEGGYGGGTSSAQPDKLYAFAARTRELNDELASSEGNLNHHLTWFGYACDWGQIDASGVVQAFRENLEANRKDAEWADVVAKAFAAAGGDGAVSTVSDAALAASLASAGVKVGRDGLSIAPATALGAVPSTGYANDPVNTATGNFIEPEMDLGFTGKASHLALSRMYNSLASGLETPGVFGPGWASVLDQHLVLSDEGCRWVLADGRAVDFPREGEGWGRGVGENFWLTREPAKAAAFAELASVPEDGTDLLVVRNNEGVWWAYSLAGVWIGTGSGPGQTVSVHREIPAAGVSVNDVAGISRVARLSHVRGRFLDIDYVDGLAAVVRASDGRRVEYGYDDGRLISVTTGSGTRTYRWNEQGLIDAVYSAAGVLEAENTYDEQGRVILQVTQHGRRTRFAYMPGRVTAVSDEDGTRSNSWIADARGRLVGVLDSHDQRQSMAYDKHGNLVSLTERDGSVTVHAYDERGRKTRTVTPEGADLTYGWDAQDRMTTLVTASGSVVSYEYADDLTRDPSVIVDPLGGRSELFWDDGLLTRLVDPAGVVLRFEYDGFGELISTCNAVGNGVRIVRNASGLPTTVVSPSGVSTRYTYNAAGLVTRREEADGAVWSFDYDSAARMTATTAPDGGRTELEYAANGELVRTIDPLGRSIERVFDELGNVSATILPDGARWGFTHDSLSRLTGITDPAGHDWVREYDKVGTLTAVVDPTGVRTEATVDRRTGSAIVADAFTSSTYSFDEYGRPTQVQGAEGSAELTTYDAAGNPVELVDGEGGLTVLARDIAGRIISVTTPSGAVTRYEYDVCGRPWKSIDPMGAVTELIYDADQRVTARILPTGDTETFEYDPCGRLVLRRTPGNGVARFGYDKAGRLSFSQDPWYGTRRFRYNLAGELVETINGVGGRTRFEYDARGRLSRITDPLGGVTEHTYTAADRVESVTDPLGRVSTATYDPAGRQLSQTDPEGHTTTWTYDRSGREVTTSYDGKLLASVDRDLMSRRVVITDYTGADGLTVEHELGFNRRGQLTSRTRGAEGLSWSYDADGRRTEFTDAAGTTTTYERNAVGRVATVRNPRLGEAVFTHDAAGRLTAVTAGELVQEWVYRNGYLAEHTRSTHAATGRGADTTLIGRDEDGRITGLTRGGAATRYGYDGAGQLVSASTTRNGVPDASGTEWEYDAAGRLVRESTSAGVRSYEYEASGQLVAVTEPDGTRTEYVHDGLGRRSRLINPDGSWTEYAWGATGYLQGTVDRNPDGMELSHHQLWVDALGELAAVDGCPVWWDTANPIPALASIGTEQVLAMPGGVTGIGNSWTAQGWRAARPTDESDPWAVIGASLTPQPAPGAATGIGAATGLEEILPAGIALTANGGLDVAGMEWLSARVYDPATRGFLSTDPLASVLGAGWGGNPYAYAGNNPLNTTDPTGLSPMTDAELKDFDKGNGSHWEYVVGAAAIVAGAAVAVLVPGAGPAIGLAIAGAGFDAIMQKNAKGTVNWGQVAATAVVGIVAGPIGGKVTSAMGAGVSKLAAGPAGTYVTSKVSSAVATGVSKLGPKVGGALSQLPGREMAKDVIVESTYGVASNTAVYGVENWGEWSADGFKGAATNGLLSGSMGSQSKHLGVNLGDGGSLATQIGIDSLATVTGNFAESKITGEEYGFGDVATDTFGSTIKVGTEMPGVSPVIQDYGPAVFDMTSHIQGQEALQNNEQ